MLNCAAIAESLQESELFGHDRGAFTGADHRRIGKFEQCSGGTLLLDEIGDMSLALQAKILRVLQQQTFERVGGNDTIQTDVRLIAATHRDLKAWAAEGKFRLDLYYRLSVFNIHLPPLRERGDDLLTLVQVYLRRFQPRTEPRHWRSLARVLISPRRYSWPGNIRELQSVLKRAMLVATGSVLLPEFLPDDLPPAAPRNHKTTAQLHLDEAHTLDELECDAIHQCLIQTDGNRQQTARLLGISTRTLFRKIRLYNLKDAGKR